MLVDEVRQVGLFALFFIFSPLWVAEFLLNRSDVPGPGKGSDGIRTPGLLVANEEKSKIRLGATVT
jgi:hypothetical protein